jgi:hypothetical protein
MKRLFLFLFLNMSIYANAQQRDFTNYKVQMEAPTFSQIVKSNNVIPGTNANQYNHIARTTNANSSWFNYFRQIVTNSGVEYFWNTYQDTTIYDNSHYAFSQRYMFLTGFGVSLDPTDSAYSYNAVIPSVLPTEQPSFVITNNDAYEIDSLYVEGQYMYNENYTDSLILEMAIVPNTGIITYSNGAASNVNNTGTYLLQTPAGFSSIPSYSGSNQPRMANADYDTSNQLASSITTTKQRYAIVLNPTDTLSNGNTYLFAISPGFQVPAGAKVVAYAHFKSGHIYPVGTTIDNANYFRFFAGDAIAHQFPPQSAPNPVTNYPGSFQAGLVGDSYAMYEPPFWIDNHRMLIPNFQFAYANGLDAPDWGFYITCTTCSSMSVPSTVKHTTEVIAYPNPANTELCFSIDLNMISNAAITLTNTLGQSVKVQQLNNIMKTTISLHVSDLVSGMYFYTVNAGDQHYVGKVFISH